MPHEDALERDGQHLSSDLGKHRLVALSLRAAAADHLHKAVGIDLKPGPFEGPKCRGLDQNGDPAATPDRPLRRQWRIPSEFGDGALKHRWKITAIEDGRTTHALGADQPGQLLRTDQI